MRTERLEGVLVCLVGTRADGTGLEVDAGLVARLLSEVPAQRLTHLVDHAAALVEDIQGGDEALEAPHLVHVAVGEAVVGAHRFPAALDLPGTLQGLVVWTEEVLALALPDDPDF